MANNPLTHGHLATEEKQTLIENRLDSKIADIISDELSQLPKVPFPEEVHEFESRFLSGFDEIISNHFAKKYLRTQ